MKWGEIDGRDGDDDNDDDDGVDDNEERQRQRVICISASLTRAARLVCVCWFSGEIGEKR